MEPQPPAGAPVPKLPEAPPLEGPAGSFVLSPVDIEGATVYPPEVLSPLYEAYLARTVTLADVHHLQDAIVVFSACPMDVTPINAPDRTPKAVHFEILAGKAGR